MLGFVRLDAAQTPGTGGTHGVTQQIEVQWGPTTLSTADAALEAMWSGAPTRTLEHDVDLARALKRLADHLHLRKQVRNITNYAPSLPAPSLLPSLRLRRCMRDVKDKYTPLVCTFFRPSCVQKTRLTNESEVSSPSNRRISV